MLCLKIYREMCHFLVNNMWACSLKRTLNELFMVSISHVSFLDEAEIFLRLQLSQLKLEYLNHLHSKFWYKSYKLMAHFVVTNATNDTKLIWETMLKMIRGVHKCYLYRNSTHMLMLLLHSTVITQIVVSRTRKLLHMTQLKI